MSKDGIIRLNMLQVFVVMNLHATSVFVLTGEAVLQDFGHFKMYFCSELEQEVLPWNEIEEIFNSKHLVIEHTWNIVFQ